MGLAVLLAFGLTELLDTNNNSITSTTLPALVADLNAVYGAGTYDYDHTPDPTTGGTTLNGPSGLVYNTHTVQVMSATFIGQIGGPNPPLPPRAPMRYQLRPVGYASNADFCMSATTA
jgi:predicted extracellular nuclease